MSDKELSKKNANVVLALCVVIALGAVVAFNWVGVLNRQQKEKDERPLYVGRVEKDMTFLNSNGEEMALSEMRGKVYLVSFVFTQCPSQCAGVIESMKEVADKYEDNEKLEFVAVSLEPDVDRPEVLKEWAKVHGVDNDRWHFLTSLTPEGRDELHEYMNKELMFYNVIKVDGPEKYEHDQRVALIDGAGSIRGFYDLLSLEAPDQVRRKLDRHLGMVLEEKQKSGPVLIWVVVLFGVVFLVFGLIFASGAAKKRAEDKK
ncbi:SCO family protein [Sulfuriroseicoccus oceanibius]|uniref:SCO family protein n=1 Tax=Sulfuriroseicoccus oceanibius TaxID=2707525 RepID=A0A6B3LDB9_9BACT|nr:SCO family protein [Sulfuriroseicoccus oceanibius]QQL44537.1 SCO family protein [Sulfuriroseicoccus oceanibius]